MSVGSVESAHLILTEKANIELDVDGEAAIVRETKPSQPLKRDLYSFSHIRLRS